MSSQAGLLSHLGSMSWGTSVSSTCHTQAKRKRGAISGSSPQKPTHHHFNSTAATPVVYRMPGERIFFKFQAGSRAQFLRIWFLLFHLHLLLLKREGPRPFSPSIFLLGKQDQPLRRPWCGLCRCTAWLTLPKAHGPGLPSTGKGKLRN